MYGPEDLEIVTNDLSRVRKLAHLLFPGSVANTAELVGMLVQEIVRYGFSPFEVVRDGDVIRICAAKDWMTVGMPVGELFERLHVPTDRGPNAHRLEALVAAFSPAWATTGEAGQASGPADPELSRALAEADAKWRRVLVWKAF
ncbi:hypothetical protein [Brevundimonas sp. GCM10030266]|uniref:hypothetical protein n=1 Tax=Brevundimonas sp. GCM10030266 TaxID=3273386 RepID=UPI00361E5EE7